MTMSEVELEHEPSTTPPALPPVVHVGAHLARRPDGRGARAAAAGAVHPVDRRARRVVRRRRWDHAAHVRGARATSRPRAGMPNQPSQGPLLFGVVTFLVLGLGLLVTPTLASTGINGDRNAGTLATLQVTLLTPAEIAAGKLLAAWAAALRVPRREPAVLRDRAGPGRHPRCSSLLRVVVVVAVLLAAVCGIGLGFSALTARTAGSTVLTFLTVAALTLLTPVLVRAHLPVDLHHPRRSRSTTVPLTWTRRGGSRSARSASRSGPSPHTERTWWLLGLNPFVVVADGAGTTERSDPSANSNDPLGAIRDGVRELRAGPRLPAARVLDRRTSIATRTPGTCPAHPSGRGGSRSTCCWGSAGSSSRSVASRSPPGPSPAGPASPDDRALRPTHRRDLRPCCGRARATTVEP